MSGPHAELLRLQRVLSAELVDVLRGDKPGTLDPEKIPQWTDSLTATQLLYQGIELAGTHFDDGELARDEKTVQGHQCGNCCQFADDDQRWIPMIRDYFSNRCGRQKE